MLQEGPSEAIWLFGYLMLFDHGVVAVGQQAHVLLGTSPSEMGAGWASGSSKGLPLVQAKQKIWGLHVS